VPAGSLTLPWAARCVLTNVTMAARTGAAQDVPYMEKVCPPTTTCNAVRVARRDILIRGDGMERAQ